MLSILGSKIYNILTRNEELEKEKLAREAEEFLDIRKQDIIENEIVKNEDPATIKDADCHKRKGVITRFEAEHGVIDDKYFFNKSIVAESAREYLEKGCIVKYLGYIQSPDVPMKVVKITEVVVQQWEEPTAQEIQATQAELQNQRPELFNTHNVSIIGKVVNRRKNQVHVKPDSDEEIIFFLDEVTSNFIPQIGDTLALQALVQTDPNVINLIGSVIQVHAITGVCSKKGSGFISSVDLKSRCGKINDIYYFDFDALEMEYLQPRKGDKVAFDAIENSNVKWRCINVVLMEVTTTTGQSFEQPDFKINKLFENKNGIEMSDNLTLIFSTLGETQSLEMIVKNTTKYTQKITRSFYTSRKSESQVTLMEPELSASISIQAGEEIVYRFKGTARFFGESNEIFVVQFDKFKIGRNIYVQVNDGDQMMERSIGSGPNVYRNTSYTLSVWKKKQDVIPGVRRVAAPKFVYRRFGNYDVQDALKNVVLKMDTTTEVDQRLDYLMPFFSEPLSTKTYERCFHHLLYLEEIQYFHNMRKYDMERAHFKREQEYLSLHIKNLSEQRPAIVLGDTIHASNPWKGLNQKPLIGEIHKVYGDRVLLKFTPEFHSKYNGEDYKLEFHFSRASLRKQHYAIDSAKHFNINMLFPSKVIPAPNLQLNVRLLNDGRLMLKKPNNEEVEIPWHNTKLNEIQKEAIVNILRGEARPAPYIIFGPPGTGKTMTTIETIIQLYKQVDHSRILVATPSNSSADLITERLAESGVFLSGEFVRLVGINAVEREIIPEHILPFCATCDIARIGTSKDEMFVSASGLKFRCNAAVLGQHRITIGTCTTLGTLMQMEFPRDHFTHVVIDECGQSTESESIIPMTLLSKENGQVILAGDPMQLGPIVLSRFAIDRGLGMSFLSRLLDRFPYKRDSERFETTGFDPRLVTKLLYSYRSLPSIMHLYSTLFYHGALKPIISAVNSVESRIINQLDHMLPNPKQRKPNHGVFFIGVRGFNQQCNESPSWYNSAEAKSIYMFVLNLYKAGFNEEDIGIITPYMQQRMTIRSMLAETDIRPPKVGTVEEFQGQERKIILVSTVRSSSRMIGHDKKHNLGFVSSTKRTNVAISRARALLVIFGNPQLLAQESSWKYILEYCYENKTAIGCDKIFATVKEFTELDNNYD